MRGKALRSAVLAAVLFAAAGALRAAADLQAADAAFEAGNAAQALGLYDEILVAEPNNVHALLRSGMLLSWDRRFDEALARYERALAREPNHPLVLLERGKVFLWSARYDEAVAAFERALRVTPKDPWALCGTAQAFAWRGRGREARPYYERALATDPKMKEALLGLGYLDLQEGETARARERVKTLQTIAPQDPEVIELDKQVRRARASWIQVGWDGGSDSDENSFDTFRAEGGFALPKRLDLRFGYTHSGFDGPVPAASHGSASADSLFGVLGWTPGLGRRGELRLGAARLEGSGGTTRTTPIGGISYGFPIDAWAASVSLAHDPFLYSPLIVDNEIDVTSFTFRAGGPVSAHARLETGLAYGDFSDGNRRLGADAGAWYAWTKPQRSLSLGGAVRYFGFSDDFDHGYFDPSRLVAGVLSLRSDGAIGKSAWTYETVVEAGVQTFTLGGVKESGEPLWSVHGLVARPLPRGFSFQIFGDFSNSSAASGPGFTSRSGGFRVRYTFGS